MHNRIQYLKKKLYKLGRVSDAVEGGQARLDDHLALAVSVTSTDIWSNVVFKYLQPLFPEPFIRA